MEIATKAMARLSCEECAATVRLSKDDQGAVIASCACAITSLEGGSIPGSWKA